VADFVVDFVADFELILGPILSQFWADYRPILG
jgi:hypothetical protein